MSRNVTVELSVSGINTLLKEVDNFNTWLQVRADELCRQCANLGYTVASIGFQSAIYDGINDSTVTAEPLDKGWIVRADGAAVLFIEFGTGITYGYGHPEATLYAMGPGTYPLGKGHWKDPKGWYLPGSGHQHTYGNPPAMPMYNARKTIEQELVTIVKGVFAN